MSTTGFCSNEEGTTLRILVTGAAGFIGSVVTDQLVAVGHDVVAIDNLKYGHRAAVNGSALFVHGDILDQPLLRRTMVEQGIEAVVHLAAEAFIDLAEKDPGLFYRTNVSGGLAILDAMVETGVRRMVFSSTAATYGQPETVPITENSPTIPCNAYGESKLAYEKMLRWFNLSYGVRSISLRYFNACGATETRGEARTKETHLIPIALMVAQGRRDCLSIFGDDYPTPDGTCVRDYIHVSDIASAHLAALAALDTLEVEAFNLGTGDGKSNLEVVEAVRKVTGHALPARMAPRRPGDPATLVASAEKASTVLGWRPAFPELETMIEMAWKWRVGHPNGYGR